MLRDALTILHPGAVFHGRYRVVCSIKVGGMGAVYEVLDEKTDAARALKVMLPSMLGSAELRARFALEAKITGGVESDHIVRVSDAGIDDATETPFLAMELLRGEELAVIVRKRKALPPGEVVTYLWQAALALDKTHAAGIVHRDLKPENLFVTSRDDGSPCVKILDFGIAKLIKEEPAEMTRALGTPLYMAPEQIRGVGEIGPRADLYALGHIAYAALAGEAYWREESKATEAGFLLQQKIVAGAAEAATTRARRRTGATLPPAFDAWFQKATAAQAGDRFEQATIMITALADAMGVTRPSRSPSMEQIFASGVAVAVTPRGTLICGLTAPPPPPVQRDGAAMVTPGGIPRPPSPSYRSVTPRGTLIGNLSPPPPRAPWASSPAPPVPGPMVEPASTTSPIYEEVARAPSRSVLPFVLGGALVLALAALGFRALNKGDGMTPASSGAPAPVSGVVPASSSDVPVATQQPPPLTASAAPPLAPSTSPGAPAARVSSAPGQQPTLRPSKPVEAQDPAVPRPRAAGEPSGQPSPTAGQSTGTDPFIDRD
jgi:serine/threonine-protein kinase